MKKILFVLSFVLAMHQVSAQIRLPDRPNRPSYIDHTDEDCGFWMAGEAHVGSTIMLKNTNALRSGVAVVGGYMVNEFIKVGVGLGVNVYALNNNKIRDTDIPFTMPLFFDFRGVFMTQEVRNLVPYWSCDIGGAIRDGFFFSPTIGLRIGEKRDSWLIGLSCGLNSIKNKPNIDSTISSMSLKIGYEF